ncbi:MAG: hypothetical protein AAGH76_02815 [Pseudomonadota bacterium]
MQHRTVSGTIRYTSTKPEWQGRDRGLEEFTFTHHSDGRMILRARCEIEEPDPTVLRDIIYTINGDGVPEYLHVHLTVGDRFLGSGWVRHDVAAGKLECESFGPAIGRLSQQLETGAPFDGIGTHPVVGDGYLTRCMDLSRGPHRRQVRVFVPSPDHRGATAPMMSEVNIGLEYVGEETRTVEAGTFDCRHYRYVDDVGPGMGGKTHPTYDMWVTADDDSVLVYGSIDGGMMNRYELVALQR